MSLFVPTSTFLMLPERSMMRPTCLPIAADASVSARAASGVMTVLGGVFLR
jgi:hypothetical protein